MTQRQRVIIKAFLEALHLMDGVPLAESVLHAEVNLRITPTASKDEFDDSLIVANNNGWVIGEQSRFGKGRIWMLSDAGQAARHGMR
jgi:hypothetical protein